MRLSNLELGQIGGYVLSEPFRTSYPAACAKWAQAAELLCDEESPESHTKIDDLLREAMQEFTTALVERFKPLECDNDSTKVKSRLRAVFQAWQINKREKENKAQKWLVTWWDSISDLVQRQERGSQKEGAPLAWPDSRRVVFDVAILMLEIDLQFLQIGV